MKYTASHEWIEVQEGVGRVGISAHAQKELGEIVFVELPPLQRAVRQGEEAAVLESTKAAADVYAPVSGTILEVNALLAEAPELVNQSPEENGWLFKIRIEDNAEVEALMDAATYREQFSQ